MHSGVKRAACWEVWSKVMGIINISCSNNCIGRMDFKYPINLSGLYSIIKQTADLALTFAYV